MGFTLNKLQVDADTDPHGFNSESFKVVIETHRVFLQTHAKTSLVPMEGIEHVLFRGSFDGWLFSKNIAEKYHWSIARINDLSSCSDYDGIKRAFLIPDLNVLDGLLQVHSSIKN